MSSRIKFFMQLHVSNTRLTLDCGLKRQYGESVAVIIIYFPLLSPCSCGFQANYIQLGLDQLLKVHNEHLLLNLLECTSLRKCQIELSLLILVPGALVYTLTLSVLCIITCWKCHKWCLLSLDITIHINEVLNFAAKHKYPPTVFKL